MTKKFVFACLCVASLILGMQLNGCYNPPIEAEGEKKYLDLNEIGVTVLISPNEAKIVLDISQEFRDTIAIINYAMDEHNLVLKSPTQTRSIYVMSQLRLLNSEVEHLQDRIRLVIYCKKPL